MADRPSVHHNDEKSATENENLCRRLLQRRQLARYELFIEGPRRPELRPFLDEISSATIQSVTVILRSAGFAPSPEQVRQLSRLLGLAFSNLTLSADSPGAQDPAHPVDRMLKTVLG